MEEDEDGVATLSNLLFDLLMERLSAKFVRQHLAAVVAKWDARTPDVPPQYCMWAVRAEDSTAGFTCCGKQIEAWAPRCSRVMAAQDFVRFNVNKRKCPVPIRNAPVTRQIRYFEENGIGAAAKGEMATTRPMAWVTDTGRVRATRHEPSPADAARDWLGLVHFRKGLHLVEVRYPRHAFAMSPLVAPTYLDGCPSVVYRSAKSTDGWGRAVRLSTLVDGFPEAVHRALTFTPDFEVSMLGPLETDAHFDERKALSKFPLRWGPGSLEELMKHVQP
jgi:hypothetical protein